MIKRYKDQGAPNLGDGWEPELDDNGEYVKYEDVKPLLKQKHNYQELLLLLKEGKSNQAQALLKILIRESPE